MPPPSSPVELGTIVHRSVHYRSRPGAARGGPGGDDHDAPDGGPERVAGERVGGVDGLLPERVAARRESGGPEQRAEDVERQEDPKAHPAVADGRVDEDRRDGEEVREHDRGRPEPRLEAVQPGEPALVAPTRAAEQPEEDTVAPAPP